MLVYRSVSQIPFLPGLRFSKALLGRVGVYLFGKSMKYDLRWTLQDWLSTIDLYWYTWMILDASPGESFHWPAIHFWSWVAVGPPAIPVSHFLFLNMTTWMDWELWMGPIPFATWYSEIDFVATAHRQIATKPPWHASRQAGRQYTLHSECALQRLKWAVDGHLECSWHSLCVCLWSTGSTGPADSHAIRYYFQIADPVASFGAWSMKCTHQSLKKHIELCWLELYVVITCY